ncbi:MAG TPA: ABC transporter substrate-binding protein [Candidatus Tectomicrobia bacterium]|jgi:NitT/TauT family transport system substrate-binding protein
MRVRLFQPFRVVFYAPIEVARHGGFLATEGLELDVTITGSSPRYLDALSRGEADIAMGGPMRTMKWIEEGHRADVVNFAEVNSRSGFFLLSRTSQPDFQPMDLVGKEVITFAEAPTPWFCLQAVLQRHGVDPGQVRCLTDLPTPVAVETFLRGQADYLLQTEPVVEHLVQHGTAFLCMAQAEACGHLAFTSYIAATSTLQTQPELIERFTRAVYRTQQWMTHHSAAEIAQAIQASFPDIPVDMLGASIERFQRLATWPADPVLRREGFANLVEVLRLAGYLTLSPSYDALVDTSIARRVMQAS